MNPTYDMPENFYFGGGGNTFTTPTGIVILVLSAILILALPKKYVIVPLLAGGLLLPDSLRIVVFGLHLFSFRLLLLAALIRLAVRRDLRLGKMMTIDKLVLAGAFSNAIAFSLLWGVGAVVNRLGLLYSTLGAYFLLRTLIRDKHDLLRTIKVLAIILVIIACGMLGEKVTGRNVFAIVGSPELSNVREGRIRAQGPFGHAIIAGTVGAVLLPVFAGMWWQGRGRLFAGIGAVAATVMTVTSASSTPVMAYAAAMFGLMLWPVRRYLRWLRWALVFSIVALQVAMKAPVWFLLARISGVTGGSGWHRAMLIDNFVHRFGDWWLIGTRDNATWGYDMWDAVNAYVGAGQAGGLITFVLYVAVFVYAYKRLGHSRQLAVASFRDEFLIWAIGCSLFSNTVAFFGIAYFDQSVLAWYTLLAMIVATPVLVPRRKTSKTEAVANLRISDDPADSWLPAQTSQTIATLSRR